MSDPRLSPIERLPDGPESDPLPDGASERAAPLQAATAQLSLARDLAAGGKWRRAKGALRAALDGFRAAGDPHGEGAVLMEEAQLHAQQARYPAALAGYRRAIRHWQRLGEKQQVAEACYALGMLALELDEIRDAQKALERARALWEQLGDAPHEAQALETLSSIHFYHESHDEGIQALQRAVRLWTSAALPQRAGEAQTALGDNLLSLEQPREGLTTYRSALALARQAEDRALEARVLGAMAMCYRVLGRPRLALGFLRQALPFVVALGDEQSEMFYSLAVGVLLHESGQGAAAIPYLTRGVALGEQSGYPGVEHDRALLRRVRTAARRASGSYRAAP